MRVKEAACESFSELGDHLSDTMILSDIAEIIMGQSPSGESCNIAGDGVPLLNGPTEFGINHPHPVQYTVDPRKMSKQGDLLFCVRGSTTGKMNWADKNYAIGRGLAAIRGKNGYPTPFVKAVIELKLNTLLAQATGSTFPNVSRDQLYKLEFPRVDKVDAIKVSSILDSLEKRIALLRETNITLEAAAQAVFKSWFVDFDPVLGNMGEIPDPLPFELMSLFPPNFIESHAGFIPSGWEIRSLDQIAEFLNGLALQKYPPTGDDDLPVIKIAQLRKGDSDGASLSNNSIKPEFIVNDGDVIFSWSGSLLVDIWCGGKGALNQHLFKVSSALFPKWFYYLWTKQHLPKFQKIAENKATTMGHIQRKHLSEANVIVPPNVVLSAADKIIAPMITQIINNSLHARSLTSLRSTILPRLISGQLQ